MLIFSLGFCVSFITGTLCWPFSDFRWPSQPENVTGQVHAWKKSADVFGGAAGYLELQPHRRCIWKGIHYLWGSVDSHSQQMYLQLGQDTIRWVLVRGLVGTAVLGTTSCWYCPSFDQSNKFNDHIQLYNSSYTGIKIRSSVQVLQKPLHS